MRGIFVSKSKVNKSVTILLSVVLLVAILSSYILLSNSFRKIEEAYADSDFYIYGVREREYVWNEEESDYDVSKNGMVLHTSDGSSGTWKKSDAYRGNYVTVGTGPSLYLEDLTEPEGWYKCGNSAPIHVMEVDYDGDTDCYTIGGTTALIPGGNGYVVSNINDAVAYNITKRISYKNGAIEGINSGINVLGKYKVIETDDPNKVNSYCGQTVWISASYGDWWSVLASTSDHPENLNESERSNSIQGVAVLKARITNEGAVFEAKLGEGQYSLNVNTDVQVGKYDATKPLFGQYFNADDASMTAVLNDDTSLNYIYLIGAPDDAEQSFKDQAPAFVLTSGSHVDLLSIGDLWEDDDDPFKMNTREEVSEFTYGTFNNTSGVVISSQDVDSAASVSWVNRQPGDVINFTLNVGSASGMSQFKTPVEETIDLIEAIGTVTYPDSIGPIELAREVYEELSPQEKEQVTNYDKLVAAEAELARLDPTPAPEPEPTQDNDTPESTPEPAPQDKSTIRDQESGVSVKTKENVEIPENITLKVEVKTSVNTQESKVDYSKVQIQLKDNEVISHIFDVKLIRTVNGVEEEIQPEDIDGVTAITVKMPLPKGVKNFRLFHIHTADDVEEITNYSVNDGVVEFEISKLSDFAIITKASHGFCVGWVLFIFVILELLATALYVVIRYGFFKEFIAKMKLDAAAEKIDFITIIGLLLSGAIFIFALIALCLHQCALTITMFIFATLVLGGFTYFFMMDDKKRIKDSMQA